MYDILVKSDIDKDIEEQVKPLIGDEFERLSIVPLQKQSNGSNCSVFSIKYPISHVLKEVQYDRAKIRSYLSNHLKDGILEPFQQVHLTSKINGFEENVF